ncbi:MAG: Spy/CpxP family protein refolding chaperone [Bacteroidia bacterium]
MENRNTVILKWSVGILIILNAVLLITFWKNNDHVRLLPPPMHHGQEGPKSFIENELGLDDVQRKKFMEFVKIHQEGMKTLHEEGRGLRDELFQLLQEESPDSNASVVMQKIAENQFKIEQLTFNHFKDLRSICNEEQKQKLSQILPHILEQLKQRGPRPPKHP